MAGRKRRRGGKFVLDIQGNGNRASFALVRLGSEP